MAKVTSREELIDFCLQSLGAPVIEINIDEVQVEQCIDMALEYFQEYHADGLEESYHQHVVTQEDIDNKFITLPEEIVSVIKLFPLNTQSNRNIQYHSYITDIINQAQRGNISNYLLNSSYLNTINQIFNNEKSINFNKHTSKLQIYTDWVNIKVDDVLLIYCYKIIDPEYFSGIYNDKWLKEYATCLIKIQWASNLRKYSGTQLPGGTVLNSDPWYQEATLEKIRLEELLRSTYELPICGWLG